MPTYEYECESCGHRFEIKQKISDAVVEECPQCQGKTRRLIQGGTGFILKGFSTEQNQPKPRCGQSTPCCGRDIPCGDKPSCE